MREEIATSLRAPPWLAEKKRVAFYAVGAAIALLLDETSPGWKTDYFLRPFAVDGYFAP
jgi:hypothetical protein